MLSQYKNYRQHNMFRSQVNINNNENTKVISHKDNKKLNSHK